MFSKQPPAPRFSRLRSERPHAASCYDRPHDKSVLCVCVCVCVFIPNNEEGRRAEITTVGSVHRSTLHYRRFGWCYYFRSDRTSLRIDVRHVVFLFLPFFWLYLL